MEQNKFTALEKLNILQEIECGDLGLKAVVQQYGLYKTSVVKWRSRYKLYGYEGMEVRSHIQSIQQSSNAKRSMIIWKEDYRNIKSSTSIKLQVEPNSLTGLRSIMVLASA